MCPHQSCTDGACTSDNGPNDVLHPFLHAVSVGLPSCPFVQAISSEKPYFVNTLRKRGEKLHDSTSPAFGEGNAISIPRPARANLTRKPCPKVIKNGAPCQRLTPTCRTDAVPYAGASGFRDRISSPRPPSISFRHLQTGCYGGRWTRTPRCLPDRKSAFEQKHPNQRSMLHGQTE